MKQCCLVMAILIVLMVTSGCTLNLLNNNDKLTKECKVIDGSIWCKKKK